MMRRWLALSFLCLCAFTAVAEVAVPPLKARVTDMTATLSTAEHAALEAKLQAFEESKGSQVAVLIVPTTQPEAIEQYSIRVVEQWQLGRKQVDDGVLLLVAKDDRKLRIEVGYGLEGILPDVIAKRIVADDIAPHFKQGHYYAGIDAGVTRIIGVIQGEVLPPVAPQRASGNAPDSDFLMYFIFVVMAGFVSAILLYSRYSGIKAASYNAVLMTLATWWIGGALLLLIIVAVVTFIITLLLPALTSGGSGGGDIYTTGGSSGMGGWGGGDGGGFSGGGGGFGGGGASGDW
jgi:uncharacterized protein